MTANMQLHHTICPDIVARLAFYDVYASFPIKYFSSGRLNGHLFLTAAAQKASLAIVAPWQLLWHRCSCQRDAVKGHFPVTGVHN